MRSTEVIARRLAGGLFGGTASWEDLRQELLLDLVTRWRKFDPSRGSDNAFIELVTQRRAATLIRHQKAASRGGGRSASQYLDTDPLDENDERRAPIPCERAQLELKWGVETALSLVPPDIRRFCELLKSGSIVGAARQMGITRHRAHQWLLYLRQHFAALGVVP